MIEELATLLETPKEKIENVVHESKCDDLSAMFNMLLDCKRQDKGKMPDNKRQYDYQN